MIEIHDLSFSKRGETLLDSIGMRVTNGKTYGIYGASGSGKSLLLALLSGALPLQEGSVRISGFDMAAEPVSAKRCIGYQPQTLVLDRRLTVYEELDLVAAARGVSEDRRFLQVHETMELFELTDLRDRLISHLTNPQLRRLALAQAAVSDAEILLSDSLTDGLEKKEAALLTEFFADWASAPEKTVFFATSKPDEIYELCHEVMLLENGRLSPAVPVSELLSGEDVTLSLAGDRNGILQVLGEVEGILSCRVLPNDGDRVSLRLRIAEEGVCEKLSRRLLAAEYEFPLIRREEPSKLEAALREAAAKQGDPLWKRIAVQKEENV